MWCAGLEGVIVLIRCCRSEKLHHTWCFFVRGSPFSSNDRMMTAAAVPGGLIITRVYEYDVAGTTLPGNRYIRRAVLDP